MSKKCDRCHDEFDIKELSRIPYYKTNKIIYLCDSCYHFIRQLYDDVIEEYILRQE